MLVARLVSAGSSTGKRGPNHSRWSATCQIVMLELSLHCLSESCHDLLNKPDVCSLIGQRLRQTASETYLTCGGLQVKDVLGFALIRSGGKCVLRRVRLQLPRENKKKSSVMKLSNEER